MNTSSVDLAFTSTLAFIINNQILTRTFSKKWTIAQICPIPKVGKSETPADYRPISVLPILSKIYESYTTSNDLI